MHNHELVELLLHKIKNGTKTAQSALLYLAEYDRLHNTNLHAQLRNALSEPPQSEPPQTPARQARRAPARRRRRNA